MTLTKTLFATVISAAAMMAATSANAATFLFTYSGTNTTNGPFTATGTLTTTNTTTIVNGRAAYTITGITGTRNGSAITGLVPAGTNFGGVPNDNYLYVATPYLTDAGFGFSVAGTGNLFNPYYFGGSYQEYVRDAAGADVQNTSGVTFAVTQVNAAVPEPATWGLMVVGFGMIGAASRSRKVKTTVAFA